jgi:hypothetical protein
VLSLCEFYPGICFTNEGKARKNLSQGSLRDSKYTPYQDTHKLQNPMSETFLILGRIQRDIIINVRKSSRRVPAITVRFSLNLHFLERFSKTPQTSNFMKISPVRAKLFHEDGRTDRQTNIMKLIVAVCNFANAPKIVKHAVHR